MKTPDPDQAGTLRRLAADVAGRIENAMHANLEAELKGSDPLLREVLDYALFNGGKRIRPLLTVLCSRCCGRDDERLYLLASAFEYLHVATLTHDDVIDKAPQRRGVASVYARYGTDIAILAGDWLHARSMYLIGSMAGINGLEVFCEATGGIVNGEFEQIRQAADLKTRDEHYFRIVRQKTGNLISAACIMGGLFAGASEQRLAALQRYGDGIGMAFQVVDDLLDFQGKTRETGKEIGNDFVEGKMTLPVLRALQQADAEGERQLKALISGDRTRPGAFVEMSTLIDRYGGFKSAVQTAQECIDTSVAALKPFSTPGPEQANAALLADLARYILVRNK